ncbi:D-lactate dehydrogenase [Entomoplasma freundtii]|uniref:Lactate dehydrogenase n=1 Tax=Entomoplasma freundtii TaxID=74700 RepID=A0A2K8NQG5_9MOLU|nr:NAD(P)-dependent oxidoreductase [Entomoplasma freundtii]ATZ16085.1 lactate dehydrogenase [Entomoplasma freundtii]TDY57013.1 D-lactate dehydrogenase [Entomoplasma freundtii]
MKVICYGVREIEKPIFEKINQKFNFELTLLPDLLSHNNIETAKGHEALLVRANCVADKINLEKMHQMGIKFLLTRTVGTNHIDIPEAKKLGFKMAYVPYYSPNAVSELAFSTGLALFRNILHMNNKFNHKDFNVDNEMFAPEVRNSIVGIIGVGRIGLETAKAWKGMGAKVLGYDLYPRTDVDSTNTLDYVDLDTLLAQADLISIHCPYIKGKNEAMVDREFIKKLKPGCIIVNAARGELINYQDLYEGLISGQISKVALDTLTNEGQIYFQKHESELPINIYEKLWSLRPRVIFTPHIGSFTDEAVENMVETSFTNLAEFLKTQTCQNEI